MKHSYRRFYMLPCWVFRVDGQKICIVANDRLGAQQAAVRQYRQEHGYAPTAIELAAIA